MTLALRKAASAGHGDDFASVKLCVSLPNITTGDSSFWPLPFQVGLHDSDGIGAPASKCDLKTKLWHTPSLNVCTGRPAPCFWDLGTLFSNSWFRRNQKGEEVRLSSCISSKRATCAVKSDSEYVQAEHTKCRLPSWSCWRHQVQAEGLRLQGRLLGFQAGWRGTPERSDLLLGK